MATRGGDKDDEQKQYEIERSRIRAVFVAAERDDVETLQSLERELQGILDYRDGKGASAIHAACRAGSARALRWILERRPDLATQFDKEGRSPLHAACLSRDGETCLEMLLEFYKENDDEGEPASSYKEREKKATSKSQIINAKQVDEGATALHLACCLSPAFTRALLEHGADPNADSTAGRPLLWCVSHAQDPEEELVMAKLLIEHGAEVNSAARFNSISPLIITCMRGDEHLKITKLLIESGANIRFMVENLSPLHAACGVGALDTVRLLLEKAEEEEEEGVTKLLRTRDLKERLYPIEHAAWAHHDLVVDYLLPLCGSFLDAKTRDELVRHTKAKVEAEERILKDLEARAERIKEEGNAAFKAGRYEEAISKYREALMQEVEVDVKEEGETMKNPLTYTVSSQTSSTLHSNVAASYLKLNQVEDALEAARAAVKCDSGNTKAQFRLGTCLSKTGDHEGAAKAFWDAYTLEKEKKGATDELYNLFNREIQSARKKLEEVSGGAV